MQAFSVFFPRFWAAKSGKLCKTMLSVRKSSNGIENQTKLYVFGAKCSHKTPESNNQK